MRDESEVDDLMIEEVSVADGNVEMRDGMYGEDVVVGEDGVTGEYGMNGNEMINEIYNIV